MKRVINLLFLTIVFLFGLLIFNIPKTEAAFTCTKYDPTFSETWQESSCVEKSPGRWGCSTTRTVTENAITGGCAKRANRTTCGNGYPTSCGRTLATDVTCATFDRNDDGRISASECVETQHYEWNSDGCQCDDIGDNDNGGGGGCNCTDWVNGACGAGSCGAGSIRQTRTCTNNCAAESRCQARTYCNNPDLDIIRFNFPGGRDNGTSDATIKIRNIGNQSINGNFRVVVYNKRLTPRSSQEWLITQAVSPGETLSHTFNNMPRPAPGNYTALAIVDYTDNINESNENNNTATDDYVSTAPPLYDISGLVYIDESPSDGSFNQGTDTRLGNVGILRRQETNNFGNRVTTCNQANCGTTRRRGEYSMLNITTGTYDVMLDTATLPNNVSVATGINNSNPRTNINLDQDRTVNFRLVRGVVPTYSISGGVFNDRDGDGTKETGEDYIAGIINISGIGSFQSIPGNGAGSGFTTPPTIPASSNPLTVQYANPPGGAKITSPTTIPPYSYANVRVGTGAGGCVPPGGDSDCNNGNPINLNFGVDTNTSREWYQSIGGDVRIDVDNYRNIIPSGTTPVCSNSTYPYLSSNSISGNLTSLTSGIVFTGTNPSLSNTGNDRSKASNQGWLVTGNKFSPVRPGTIRTSYTYIDNIIKRGGLSDDIKDMFGAKANRACTQNNGDDCNFAGNLLNGGIYKSTNRVTIRGSGTPEAYTFPDGRDYIFLIEDNLRIESNIQVPQGSTVTFIVSGDITVSPSVTEIDGIYSANGSFITRSRARGVDTPLTIEGNVIVNAGLNPGKIFDQRRDLGDTQNAICPAVTFISRPDFILNGPELLRYTNYIIQEIAPGSERR